MFRGLSFMLMMLFIYGFFSRESRQSDRRSSGGQGISLLCRAGRTCILLGIVLLIIGRAGARSEGQGEGLCLIGSVVWNLYFHFYGFAGRVILQQGFQLAGGGDGMSVKAGQDVSGFQTCIFSGTAGGHFGDIDAGRHIVCLLDLAADIEAFDADRSLIFCGNLCSGLLIHQIFNDIGNTGDRDCIAHALYLCRSKFCGVDTDDLSVHVQKSAAAVARVDGCIGL